MPRKNQTANQSVAENPAPAETPAESPAENVSNGSKRGRKPAPWSRAALQADIENWLEKQMPIPDKYQVTPREVKGTQIMTFEVISTPVFVRQHTDNVNLFTEVQYATDGTFRYNVVEKTLRTFEYQNGNFVLVAEPTE